MPGRVFAHICYNHVINHQKIIVYTNFTQPTIYFYLLKCNLVISGNN